MIDSLVCMMGCVSLFPGCTNKIVNHLSFFPPNPSGFQLASDNKILLHNGYQYVPPNCDPQVKVEVILLPYCPSDEKTCTDVSSKEIKTVAFIFRYDALVSSTSKLSMSYQEKQKQWILYSHGNSTDIGYMYDHYYDLCKTTKANIFAYEYIGYGPQEKNIDFNNKNEIIKPSEENLYISVNSAYNYLTTTLDVDPKNIILYGQSIGSSPTIELASKKNNIGGIIIHSGLRSGLTVLRDGASSKHWFDVFKNEEKMGKVNCPAFIIHGKQDKEIKIEHGYSLYEAANDPFTPWWVDNAGHNDIDFKYRNIYMSKIISFLNHVHFVNTLPTDLKEPIYISHE